MLTIAQQAEIDQAHALIREANKRQEEYISECQMEDYWPNEDDMFCQIFDSEIEMLYDVIEALHLEAEAAERRGGE